MLGYVFTLFYVRLMKHSEAPFGRLCIGCGTKQNRCSQECAVLPIDFIIERLY